MIFKIIFVFVLPMLLAIAGLWQTFVYFRLKKYFDLWPVVAAEITHSRLLNQTGVNGEIMLEGIIHFKYSIRGKDYKSDTPALRGYDLFPSLNYERSLVKKYPKGEFVNARVHPNVNSLAYLEVAPLSKLSTVLAPLMFLLGVGIMFGYFYGWWELIGDNIVEWWELYKIKHGME
ncbi:DUF3592 domain-containing protein [bacterium SCSIO 12696]|nr:DUF3592 domain-containing protein [bacterium SCSIO 12696]